MKSEGRNLFLLLALTAMVVICSCSTKQEVVENKETNESGIVQKWNFIQLSEMIKGEFPEAYDNFTNISFEKLENSIYPDKATFLIPTRFFKDSLNIDILKERTHNLLTKMGGGACESMEIGESKEYAWSAWDDKVVTKVIIHFHIGC